MPPGARKKPIFDWKQETLKTPTTPFFMPISKLPLPKPVLKPMNSRTFMNTDDSTIGLGKGALYNPANHPPVGGGNGGNSGGGGVAVPTGPAFTPQVADLSKNPYNAPYDELLAYVKANAAQRTVEGNTLADTFKRQQAAADLDMHNMYAQSRVGADASATALGLDPNAASANRDFAMRHSQENSDQSLADNMAWVQKLGSLSSQMATATGNMYAQEKANKVGTWNSEEQKRIADLNLKALQDLIDQKLAASSGGGGGGGGKKKKKGGGSSSSGGDTVTKTDTLYNSGLDAAYADHLDSIGQHDAAALFRAQTNLTEGSPALKSDQQHVNDLTAASHYTPSFKPMVNDKWFTSKFLGHAPQAVSIDPAKVAKAKKAAQDLALWKLVLAGHAGMGGVNGAPNSKTVIVQKGKG